MPKTIPLPPMSPRQRHRLRAILKSLGITYAQSIQDLDPVPPIALHIHLLEMWYGLSPKQKRAWDKASQQQNRCIARQLKMEVLRATLN